MTAPVLLYGLSTCDTCRKARKWLERRGVAHQFIDYREHRVPPEALRAWAKSVGGWDKLINRASTTWRNLPDARKKPESEAEWSLLAREHPTLVKRPVLVLDDAVHAGFTDALYRRVFDSRA
jgi:Spx/MgsR family transcriptional regulator